MTTTSASRPTLVPQRTTWTAVKCPACGKPIAEVLAPTEIRMRCPDRGCRIWVERVISA